MNTGDPFKLRVLHALTDIIKEVTPANGYGHNLADFVARDRSPMSRVFRGRPWFGESDPIPMVSVLEAPDEAEYLFTIPPDDGSGTYEWALVVQGFVNDDPMNPTDPAYRLMRDVRRRLAREKKRRVPARQGMTDPLGTSQWNLPGCRVTDLKVSSGKVRPADDISAKAYFYLVVILTLTEDAEAA